MPAAAVTGVSGRIAIIDFTLLPDGTSECASGIRATNALNAGATGIIFVAPPDGLLNLGSIAAIASVQVTNDDGATIKAGLPADATISLAVGTDTSYRWLSGEDDPAFGGAIRDLWNPTCFGDPASVTAGLYTCSAADGGGVHTNSGVPNHAFALAVDGGTFNGQTITGIGMTRAAHVYFRAMVTYQGPASDFADHADALEQSCDDLVAAGRPLTDLFGGPAVPITAAHCDELDKVVLATGLRTPPDFCNFAPILDPSAPPPARPAAAARRPSSARTSRRNPFPAWTRDARGLDARLHAPRLESTPRRCPSVRAQRLLGPDPDIGTCAVGGDESGVLFATSPAFVVPAGAAPRLSFDHWVATEPGFDGGNVKISVNGGPFVLVGPQDFSFNPYNVTMDAAPTNTSPLAGQPGFSGTDGGEPDGSWGRSFVNLAPYASAGDSVRLRFEFGSDGCTGNVGWYVDDVTVFHCSGSATLSVADASVVEGNAGPTATRGDRLAVVAGDRARDRRVRVGGRHGHHRR